MLPILAALGFSYLRVFDLYELQTYDWRSQIRGARPVSRDIVLVDIWDDTLQALGAWPIDRVYHSDLIRILANAGVKSIGFDTLFVESRAGDEEVVKAAKNAGNVYFVEALFNPTSKNRKFYSDRMLAPIIDAYAQAAKGIGHVNAKADIDGKRRRVFPTVNLGGKEHVQLAVLMAMDAMGVKDLKLPLDDEGYFLVSFAGKWEKTFQHYSYYDILASYLEQQSGEKPRIDLNLLKNKFCFVGLTSLGSHDTSPVPVQSVYPMVGLYANVLNNILMKDFVRRLDRFSNLLILILCGAGVVFISFKYRPLKALLFTLGFLMFFISVGIVVFYCWGLWVDMFYPMTLFVLIYAVTTFVRTVLEMRKRELIEAELKIASQIQKSFLPEKAPQEKGIDIAMFMQPAKAVGGDLYTFVHLSEERLGVMVGDVSGKGTPAALFMAKVVSEFKFLARGIVDPAQVLSDLNNSIASESTGGLFVTLCYAIFDMKEKKLLLSNGGHLPLVSTNSDGRLSLLSAEEGMPIGVMPDVPFNVSEWPLKNGDCFMFYSDGISEARNTRKEEYGADTLGKVLITVRDESSDKILNESMECLNRFIGKADQHDDMTLIIVKVTV